MIKSLVFLLSLFPLLLSSAEPKVIENGLNTSTLNIQRISKLNLTFDKDNNQWLMELAGYALTNTSDGNTLSKNPEGLTLTLIPELYSSRSFVNNSVERKYRLALGLEQQGDFSKPISRIVATGGHLFEFKAQLILPQPKNNFSMEILYNTDSLNTKNIDLEWNLESKKWDVSYGPHNKAMPKISIQLESYTVQNYGVPYWNLTIDKVEQVSEISDYLSFKVEGKYAPLRCTGHKIKDDFVHYMKYGPEDEVTQMLMLGLVTSHKNNILDPLGITCKTADEEKDFKMNAFATAKTNYFKLKRPPYTLIESTTKSVNFPMKDKDKEKVQMMDIHYQLKDKVWKEFGTPGAGHRTLPLPILD